MCSYAPLVYSVFLSVFLYIHVSALFGRIIYYHFQHYVHFNTGGQGMLLCIFFRSYDIIG